LDFLKLDELGFSDIPCIVSTTVDIDCILVSNTHINFQKNECARKSMQAQNPMNMAFEGVSARNDQQRAQGSHTHPATVKSVGVDSQYQSILDLNDSFYPQSSALRLL
jgi:hypothetical protein